MDNKFAFKDGQVSVNGAEIHQVTDLQIHAHAGEKAEITIRFLALNPSATFSESQKQ